MAESSRICMPVEAWSHLHVNSCLGRAVLVGGKWVFTGEGYVPTVKPEVPYRAEDLTAFPPQFPLMSRSGALGRFANNISPRFADWHFERRYQMHRGQGMDSVQLCFAGAISVYCASLWGYHLTSLHGLDTQARVGVSLMHAVLFIAWIFWGLARAVRSLRVWSSELHALQVSLNIAIFCWGLPATARPTCSDMYTSFDSNLMCTIFVTLCYASVFCRMGTRAFSLCVLATLVNFLAARFVWAAVDSQPFVVAFEAPKLIVTLFILGAGVRRTDVHLRRDFAAREVMLMLIQEQGQEIEAQVEAKIVGSEEPTPPSPRPEKAPDLDSPTSSSSPRDVP